MCGLGGSVGCAVRLETRRSRVQPPPRSATFFRGDCSWNIFYGHSLPSADSRKAVVSFWRKNVHNTGQPLRGLSLPSKREVRWTERARHDPIGLTEKKKTKKKNRMYERRAKARMTLWACVGRSESAHFAPVRRHFFAWRGPFTLYRDNGKSLITEVYPPSASAMGLQWFLCLSTRHLILTKITQLIVRKINKRLLTAKKIFLEHLCINFI